MHRPNPAAHILGLALSLLLVGTFVVGAVSPTPLQAQERPIVVIDPGHGGSEAGVVVGDLVEKDLVLRLAYTTAAQFVKEGFDVRLTRTGDYNVPGDDRRSLAEEAGASLLIMLHMIQSEDPNRHGAEIYFSQDVPASVQAARTFAGAMEADGVVVVLEARDRPFLASPDVPTVMIEAGFLTHPVEQRFLQTDDYHQVLARMFVDAAREVVGAR
jgi:N-acetylmuramoyl-L-alanine amidase